jgi:hypothetical protein
VALTCAHCGQVLDRSQTLQTRAINHFSPEVTKIVHTKHIGKISENGVAIYVGNSEEPIITTIKTRAILGRRRELPEPELIDLTAYDAYRLGLSRNHAVLFFKDGALYVQDVGSANGTWLNGSQLQPYEVVALIPGSTIGLSKLSICVYF